MPRHSDYGYDFHDSFGPDHGWGHHQFQFPQPMMPPEAFMYGHPHHPGYYDVNPYAAHQMNVHPQSHNHFYHGLQDQGPHHPGVITQVKGAQPTHSKPQPHPAPQSSVSVRSVPVPSVVTQPTTVVKDKAYWLNFFENELHLIARDPTTKTFGYSNKFDPSVLTTNTELRNKLIEAIPFTFSDLALANHVAGSLTREAALSKYAPEVLREVLKAYYNCPTATSVILATARQSQAARLSTTNYSELRSLFIQLGIWRETPTGQVEYTDPRSFDWMRVNDSTQRRILDATTVERLKDALSHMMLSKEVQPEHLAELAGFFRESARAINMDALSLADKSLARHLQDSVLSVLASIPEPVDASVPKPEEPVIPQFPAPKNIEPQRPTVTVEPVTVQNVSSEPLDEETIRAIIQLMDNDESEARATLVAPKMSVGVPVQVVAPAPILPSMVPQTTAPRSVELKDAATNLDKDEPFFKSAPLSRLARALVGLSAGVLGYLGAFGLQAAFIGGMHAMLPFVAAGVMMVLGLLCAKQTLSVLSATAQAFKSFFGYGATPKASSQNVPSAPEASLNQQFNSSFTPHHSSSVKQSFALELGSNDKAPSIRMAP